MENKIELVCPECNEKFNVDIFTSINVQMDKDMKNRVLSGKLFDMECAHCHSKFHIPYPVLYHDMEKKLLIQFTEEKLDNRNQVKIKKISMIFHGFYCTLKIPEEKALFFRVV